MKNLFSIAVHESPDCVIDMCRNIIYFVPESIIVLHYKKGFNCSIPSDLQEFVHVNDHQYATGFMDGSLTIVHLSNLYFIIDKKIDFDYFSPFGSNQLFVKCGFSKYVMQFDSSLVSNFSESDSQRIVFNKDKELQNLSPNTRFLKSAPEGTFYRADLVKEFLLKSEVKAWFDSNQANYLSDKSLIFRSLIRQVIRGLRFLNLAMLIPSKLAKYGYASEEIFFPSFFSGNNCGDKTCFIPWDRESLFVTKDDVATLSQEESVFYSVKRIERKANDKVRLFIKDIIGNNYE
ncbi:hypothetical protein ACPSLZ_14865 [Vibrio campbellii]|uniref:hypothetical protein n=1 Tax=Vibrio campbellii TaxID=680 RepID=UPI003CE48E18